MNLSIQSAGSSRAMLLGLLALGAYTSAHACPCGCVKVCVDNLYDRPVPAADTYTLDLRYDSIDQDERNDGAHAHVVAFHRNMTATLETKLGEQVVSLAVPRIDRVLRTAGSSQEVVGLGDVTLATRFPWSWAGLSILAGVKLPTGADDTVLLMPRRYLQPGTGSTDLILGLRGEYGASADRFAAFWQFTVQGSVVHDEHFRPGTSLTASAGLRYAITDSLAVSLQAAAIRQFRDFNGMAAAGYATYAEDLESSVFSTHAAAGLVWRVVGKTSVYVYYSEPLNVVNKSDKPTGAEINPVHSSSVWSVGVSHAF